MELKQFNILKDHKQLRFLLMNGVCMADRKTEDAHVLLFQLNCFYYEVYFNLEDDEVLYSRSFEDIDELEPYLTQSNHKGSSIHKTSIY